MGWVEGLLTSLLLIAVLGVPLLIIVGGGAYLLVGWLRPGSPASPAPTHDDEHEAIRRDLARVEAKRAKRTQGKAP
jgi:hypothetical protein